MFQDGQLVFKHEAAKSKGVVCMQIVGKLLFAGCYNGNIYVYNIKTNDYLGTMKGPGGLLLCMNIVDDKVRNILLCTISVIYPLYLWTDCGWYKN